MVAKLVLKLCRKIFPLTEDSVLNRILTLFLFSLSGPLLPSLFAIFGCVLMLSLIAVGTKRVMWPKLHGNGETSQSKASDFVTPAYVTPLYVHRITQARLRLAQRRLTQVCANIGLLHTDTQADCGLLKKKREKIREKRKDRLEKGPRIDPDKLKRINHDWHLFYGFKSRDLFHVENELDNTVCKVPCFDSEKSKTVKFNDSVIVVFIERNNTGRRVNRCKVSTNVANNLATGFTFCANTIV